MSRKILVADDEASIRSLMSKYLHHMGFTVETATDGVDALEKIERNDFGAMVLDIMMPRLDGFGVLERLREMHSGLPKRTVVVTAFPQSALKELGGTCRVLSKPFDLRQLVDAVEECLSIAG